MSFFKSLLLGLKRKIWEPIMIVLTVTIAVATFVSALTLRDSVRKSAEDSYRAFSGECELEATLSEDYSVYYLTSDSQVYRSLESECDKYGDLYAGYLFYASLGSGDGSFAQIYATDAEDLAKYNEVSLLEGESKKSRTGVVLSEPFAKKIGAKTGDYISATRYGSAQSFTLTVLGVAEPLGVFRQADALLSEEGATRLLSLGDNTQVYNKFFVDLSEQKMNSLGVTEAQAKDAIAAACPLFDVASPVKEKNVEVTLSYQSTLLFMIALIVAVLGVILIYTAVSLVMKNRVSVAALFKSVGASNGGLTLYLLAEVLLYGVAGGLLGLGASYGVGALFAAITGAVLSFSVGWLAALLGILFGVVLSLLSALIPVLRLSYAPLYDMLHEASPVLRVKALPAAICGGIFVALFLWTAFATVSSAFVVGIFAFLALLAALFAVAPLVVKGVASLVARLTKELPKAGKLYLAAAGAKHNRHAHSGARLFAIAVMAVVAVGALLGESSRQLSSFNDLFRANIVISASSENLVDIAAEAKTVDGVSGAYLAYVATRCELEGDKDNTVSLLAARGQEYEEVFRASEFGVSVAALCSNAERYAAIGGGLALKMGLSVGDKFALSVDGTRVEFVLCSLIDTPLTVVFADLSTLGLAPNVCLAKGTDAAYSHLAEKYALEGAVYTSEAAFGYVIDLALAYIRVFTIFEILVCVFALAGYLNTAIASYRDRKRERELLLAAGADKGTVRDIVALENVLVLVTACVLGAVCSVALLFIVQNMLKSLGLYFSLLG